MDDATYGCTSVIRTHRQCQCGVPWKAGYWNKVGSNIILVKKKIKSIIDSFIYSKYFSVSDWFKSPGYFKTWFPCSKISSVWLSHNLVDINTEQHLIPNSELRTRNSHAFKYRMPKVSKDVFKFSFFPRSITEWNSLPADLVNCKSLSDFKLNLGKHVK